MIWGIEIFVLIALGVFTIWDWKFKQIPSFLLTSVLFAIATYLVLLGDLFGLGFGVVAFLFGLLLYDINFFGGMADVKVVTIMGLLTLDTTALVLMILFVMIFGTTYKLIFRYALKKKASEEVPFLIPLFVTYCALLILQGVG